MFRRFDRPTMFFQNDDASLGGGEPEIPAPQGNTVQPRREETADYWKSKYDGSLGYAKNLQTQLDKYKQDLFDLRTQAEGAITEKEATKGTLEKLLADKEKALADQMAANQRYEQERSLRSTLRQQYPGLVEDFDEGVLNVRGLEGDELTAYLDKYAERNNKRTAQARQQGVDDAIGGSTPPPPPPAGNAQLSEDQLFAALSAEPIGSPNYERLMTAYIAATATKGKQLRTNDL